MVGTISLSIEIELGWGMHDIGVFDHLSEGRTAETKALDCLLNLSENFDIPITFPVVGHLLHNSCNGAHGNSYPDNWWANDPGSSKESNPYFYAPDLIKKIEESSVNHEIATHTYSHLLADEATPEQLNSDLAKVEKVHSDFGLPPPTSIAMPRHHKPDYSVLSDHGIKTIRIPINKYEPSLRTPVSKVWWLWNRSHPISNIKVSNGILETAVTPHPSLTALTLPKGQATPHPVFSIIPKRLRRQHHRRYLKNAIELAVTTDSHVHLWTHLYNLSNVDQCAPVKNALSYLAQRRDEEQLIVRCMDELDASDTHEDC
jgi:hypothetical protein